MNEDINYSYLEVIKLHFDYIQNKTVTGYRQSDIFSAVRLVKNKQSPVEFRRSGACQFLVILHKRNRMRNFSADMTEVLTDSGNHVIIFLL